jgi:ABC-type proline/glycine betaine transport system permease subunit
MKLLNQLKYRIAFSVLIAFVFVLASTLWSGTLNDFSILKVFVAAVIIFIPLTILWAIISTFFMDDEKKPSDDLVDR